MAITFVNHVLMPAGASGGTSGAINTTGANFIAVVLGGATPFGVTDNQGNTYTARTAYSTNPSVQTFYCANPIVSASHTFSNTGSFTTGSVTCWSGVASSPYDTENGSNTLSPGAVTPSLNGSLLVAGISDAFGALPTIDSGFSDIQYTTFTAGLNYAAGSATLVQSTAGLINLTWTSSGAISLCSNVTVFKPSAAVARGLFLPPSLSGLGAGGSFFSDRLASA